MRVLYPDIVYGAIASSGWCTSLFCVKLPKVSSILAVTHASLENWEYMEIIRKAADLKCTGNLQLSVQIIDGLLASPLTRNAIKSLFGLSGLEHDEDFASVIEVCAV